MAYIKKYYGLDEVAIILKKHDESFRTKHDVLHLIQHGDLDVWLEVDNVTLVPASDVYCTSLDIVKYKKLARSNYNLLKQEDSHVLTLRLFLRGYCEWRRHIRTSKKELCVFTKSNDGKKLRTLDPFDLIRAELSLLGRDIGNEKPIKTSKLWSDLSTKGNIQRILAVDKPVLVRPYSEAYPFEGDLTFLDNEVPRKMDSIRMGHGLFKCLFAGESWFVVKINRFKNKKFNCGGNGFMPLVGVRDYFLNVADKDGNLFVTRKSIMEFEQRVMGIDHRLDIDTQINSEQGECIKAVYQDPDHEFYSRELDIAIKAHAAVLLQGEGNPSQAVTIRIKTWLEKNYPNESGAFYDRITTVVNPKK